MTKRVQLVNSMWCVDQDGKLGMIAEVNSGVATFFHEKTDIAEGDSPGLEAKSVQIPLDKLTLAPAAEVPARCGYTAEQLEHYGYE